MNQNETSETRDQHEQVEPVTPERKTLPKVSTHIKAGPARRMENFGDPIGNYNFIVERP